MFNILNCYKLLLLNHQTKVKTNSRCAVKISSIFFMYCLSFFLDMGDDDTKNLLKSCAENLLNAVSRLENRPQENRSSQGQGQEAAPSVAEEHRRLFGYRAPNNSNSCRNGRQPAPKRRLVTTSTGERVTIPVCNTWTRTFVCLKRSGLNILLFKNIFQGYFISRVSPIIKLIFFEPLSITN